MTSPRRYDICKYCVKPIFSTMPGIWDHVHSNAHGCGGEPHLRTRTAEPSLTGVAGLQTALCKHCGLPIYSRETKFNPGGIWLHDDSNPYCADNINLGSPIYVRIDPIPFGPTSSDLTCHCPWEYEYQNPELYCDFCDECISVYGPRESAMITLGEPAVPAAFCNDRGIPLQWLQHRNPRSHFILDPWMMRANIPWTIPGGVTPMSTGDRVFRNPDLPEAVCPLCKHDAHGYLICSECKPRRCAGWPL